GLWLGKAGVLLAGYLGVGELLAQIGPVTRLPGGALGLLRLSFLVRVKRRHRAVYATTSRLDRWRRRAWRRCSSRRRNGSDLRLVRIAADVASDRTKPRGAVFLQRLLGYATAHRAWPGDQFGFAETGGAILAKIGDFARTKTCGTVLLQRLLVETTGGCRLCRLNRTSLGLVGFSLTATAAAGFLLRLLPVFAVMVGGRLRSSLKRRHPLGGTIARLLTVAAGTRLLLQQLLEPLVTIGQRRAAASEILPRLWHDTTLREVMVDHAAARTAATPTDTLTVTIAAGQDGGLPSRWVHPAHARIPAQRCTGI